MLWTAQIETASGHPGRRAQSRQVLLWRGEPDWFRELDSSREGCWRRVRAGGILLIPEKPSSAVWRFFTGLVKNTNPAAVSGCCVASEARRKSIQVPPRTPPQSPCRTGQRTQFRIRYVKVSSAAEPQPKPEHLTPRRKARKRNARKGNATEERASGATPFHQKRQSRKESLGAARRF